ncbi:MAG: class I SAM-dependent methyltransferase [Pirellula sp.]
MQPPSNDAIEAINRRAYDAMAKSEHFLTTPVLTSELSKPLEILDARGWLGGDIRGWKVLCLAAGGGRQGPLYAAAGAEVTVVDISPEMLETDRRVAAELGMNLRILNCSMVDLAPLRDEEFDLVAHPVSTCYVVDVASVFREVSRVLKPGGLYVSQHKQPVNLQASLRTMNGYYTIETAIGERAKSVAPGESSWLREPNTAEFAHSLEAILGGICRSGMLIEDISEPDHAKANSAPDSMSHRSRFIPPYLRIKARKRGDSKPRSLILF